MRALCRFKHSPSASTILKARAHSSGEYSLVLALSKCAHFHSACTHRTCAHRTCTLSVGALSTWEHPQKAPTLAVRALTVRAFTRRAHSSGASTLTVRAPSQGEHSHSARTHQARALVWCEHFHGASTLTVRFCTGAPSQSANFLQCAHCWNAGTYLCALLRCLHSQCAC